MSVKSVGVSLYDRVPITFIPRHESVFQVWVMASNFNSQLTKTFLSVLGCTPRFNVPGRRQQSGHCDKNNENDSPSDLPASDERSVASTTLIAEQQEDKSLHIYAGR